MPDLMDRLYCSEQIHIPPTFPFIMKLYCKAAIRTQPYDLLKWSAAYFRALANGEEPPVKDRIEYPPYDSPTGLTPGYIKMLIKQLGKDPQTTVSAQTLFSKWNCICLEDELLIKLIALMGAKTNINWLKFVSVASGYICSTLTNSMILVCELLTDEPEGGMATIPLEVFNELYTYLAYMECGPLTEEEKKELQDQESEEDASVIAEKIRSAVYEGELEEEEPTLEGIEEEGERERELPGEEEGEREREQPGEEEAILVEKESEDEVKEEVMKRDGEGEAEEKEEAGETVSSEDIASRDILESKESIKFEDAASPEPVDETLSKDAESVPSHESALADNEEEFKEETLAETTAVPTSPSKKTSMEETEGKTDQEKEKKPTRRIKLEDIEESIRRKIEEKLGIVEDSTASEEGFQDLTSYLLEASARERMFTAEEIGYRIFKKYTRQEVPGIGPKIDKAEVEKVIDFMDYCSHKQEGMVMPRNIRHWMCPPLDKVPYL